MPEHSQLRALLAISHEYAGSALRAFLRARGDVTEIAGSADTAASIRASAPDLLLIEISSLDGPLPALHREFPSLPIVALVPPSTEIGFHAARHGATEMIILPAGNGAVAERLTPILDCLKARTGARESFGAKANGADAVPPPGLFSSSPRMAAVRHTIDQVSATSATVLIRGESGVGKEIVARMIFARSGRSQKPFVKVNCAAIPSDLLESELFGYDAGAFTGANRSKPGKFELADGGTLFLDEIGEMHPLLQAKLLHVLQDGEFTRLGARRDTAVDVRVLCATNKLLEQRVSEGLFREDLFYRINVVTVQIPPLRERRDEIPVLLSHFIERYSTVYSRRVDPLGEEALDALIHYSWPGNIRELENFCKRYVIVGDATQMVRELTAHQPAEPPTPALLEIATGRPLSIQAGSEPSLLEIGRRAAWQAERHAIEEMLTRTRWNRREAARRLQVSYKALLNRIRQINEESGAVSCGYEDAE